MQQLIVKYQPGAPIVVVGDDSIARPVTCSYADDCDPPLRGGTGMYTGGMEECTSAFLSRSRTDNKLYMLTAGHCTYFFAGASWNEHTASGTAHVLGTSYKSSYHTALNHDAGLILVSNTTYWQARAWVVVYRNDAAGTTDDFQYNITDAQPNTPGFPICQTGYFSGTTCTTVKGVSQTANYCDREDTYHNCLAFTLVTDLASTYTCPVPGDSGGPVYKLHHAYGIISAASTSPDGTCFEGFYSGINQSQNDMNVNISTEG